MRNFSLPSILGLVLLCLSFSAQAQTAKVQVIHNSPDPAAALVDVYVNGALLPALDDFAFRAATPFVDVPTTVNIGVALPNSTSVDDTLVNFPFTLMPDEVYVVVAQGVLNPVAFDQTANGAAIAFGLDVVTPADTSATAGNISIAAIHGAADVGGVDVLANGGVLLDNLAYGTAQGYIPVPATEYVLQVTPENDNATVVASYYVDLAPLDGGSAFIFASGFLDPSANQNGEAFGLFAALTDGTVLPLTLVGNARAQVIHNAADPAAAVVDIYINALSDTIKLDDFSFRDATAFVDLPTEYEVDIVIAGPTSTDITDAVVATIPATLMNGESYTIVANGVLNPANFAVNPDGTATAFELLVATGAQEAAAGTGVDLRILHGSTDAISVGVNANGGVAVPAASYTNFTGYLAVPAAEYRFDITGANDPATLIAPFYADLSSLDGGAALVFASGFLTPADNQNGEAFGLFAALPDGTVLPLTAVGNARAQVIHNAADPGAATVDIYVNMLADTLKLDNFNFRSATPFVDLPTGYELDIVIAGPNSTDITDNITTISATLEGDSTYAIIANGVLDPMMFAVNPDGTSTAFGLFVTDGVREAGLDAANVDLNVFHGATDAPTVDVLANGGTPPLIDDLTYTAFSGYASVPAADYDLTITLGNDNTAEVATFDADVTSLGGGAGMILASGFLKPEENQNGEGFGLLLVLADGSSSLLPLTVSIFDNLSRNNDLLAIAPNPFNQNATLTYSVEKAGTVNIQIMDMAGRTLQVQQLSAVTPGSHELELRANDFAPGMYQVIMTTETSIAVQKIQVLR